MNNIAAIWARVSSIGQQELSLDGQSERVKGKLESLGYIIPPEFIFKVTWTSLDLEPCPEFQELRKLIINRKINAVGFLDRDRLQAVGRQRLNFLADCRFNEVEPIAYQGPAFMSEPEADLVELAFSIGKERSAKRAQTGAKQGLADRAKLKGLPPTTKKVYGMKWREHKFVPDESYGNVSLIWKSALSGMNLKCICKQLTSRGIATPRGKLYWQPSTLHAILDNPIYAGRFAALRYEKVEPKKRRKNTFGKTSFNVKPIEQWHFIDGLVEQPIITWQRWQEVQERLSLNKEYARRNAKHEYLLRHFIQCEACYKQQKHRSYYGVKRTSQPPAYVCSSAWAQTHRESRCSSKAIPCCKIEEDVKSKIRSFLESPETYLNEIRGRLNIRDKTIADIEQAIKDNAREYRNTIDNERDSLKLTPEAFESYQQLIITKREWLKKQKERLAAKLVNLRKYKIGQDAVESLSFTLKKNLDRATKEDWRFILESLGCKIIAFEDGTWDMELNVPIPGKSIAYTTPEGQANVALIAYTTPRSIEHNFNDRVTLHLVGGKW